MIKFKSWHYRTCREHY